MGLHQLDYLFFDDRCRRASAAEFRIGQPSGMLVAIAGFARLVERTAGSIERWARRPASAELPRIPAR